MGSGGVAIAALPTVICLKVSFSDGLGGALILGVSNIWSNDKGLSDLMALSKIPDNVVVLVGMNEAQVKEYSSEKYRDCNLIPIHRTHNQYELPMLYSLADVYVNPTYADMFPTVNLEALACGTPIITYKTGGSPEAVDEKTGVVVEQGNVKALADAIHHMKEHPLSSEACRKRAEERFDKDKCFEKYIELYESLLNGDNKKTEIKGL